MGLDLSICKVKKYKEVPFSVIYNQVTDEVLQDLLKDNEGMKNKEIQYYNDEEYYTADFSKKQIERIEKRYQRYEEEFRKFNIEYNKLSEEDKKAIKELEQKEYKYYGKNWDLFGLLDNELSKDVFDDETQTPISHLEKEILEEVLKINQKHNKENEGVSHLQSFLSKADFDNYYYFIEAGY